MNLLVALQEVFNIPRISVSERVKQLECSFDTKADKLPNYANITELFNHIPQRDSVKLTLIDDSDDCLYFEPSTTEDQYADFRKNALLGEIVKIELIIEKNLADNYFSIYSFNSFIGDILNLSIEDIFAAFSLLLKDNDYISFELFDTDVRFMTKTLSFAPTCKRAIISPISRSKRIRECQDTSYFYNMSLYPLLPDDFKMEIDYKGNPLTELFNKLVSILSLIYISLYE